SELSGGMARRLALSRSIAMDPEIMMYDEPFTGQDPESFNKLLELISNLNESLNMTSIIVSHDIQDSLSRSDHLEIVGLKKS
ncbi:ATP-binding cassette domain-containing protein, partial [Francisella tularensis subsp. holarctica]|uniref:ATP-binding cassette domain-containing protein n=1 Tax=Francisella tularensis TaxID=263 RepID=UPI002381BB2A